MAYHESPYYVTGRQSRQGLSPYVISQPQAEWHGRGLDPMAYMSGHSQPALAPYVTAQPQPLHTGRRLEEMRYDKPGFPVDNTRTSGFEQGPNVDGNNLYGYGYDRGMRGTTRRAGYRGHIRDYLVFAIVTIICCLPFGIAATICAVQGRSAKQRGDYDEAKGKSNCTLGLCIAGVILGIVYSVSLAVAYSNGGLYRSRYYY